MITTKILEQASGSIVPTAHAGVSVFFIPAFPVARRLWINGQNATAGDRSAHERVELLVPLNRKLQVPLRDGFDAATLRRFAFSLKQP